MNDNSLCERLSSPTEQASNETNINTNNATESVQLGAAPCSHLDIVVESSFRKWMRRLSDLRYFWSFEQSDKFEQNLIRCGVTRKEVSETYWFPK